MRCMSSFRIGYGFERDRELNAISKYETRTTMVTVLGQAAWANAAICFRRKLVIKCRYMRWDVGTMVREEVGDATVNA